MKKFLVVCLVVLVLGGIVLAVGGYVVYRAAAPVIQTARDYLDRFSQLGELEKQVKNQAPFTAPQRHELSNDHVERFVRVQEHVRSALGRRFDEIEAKYTHLKANAEGSQPPSFAELMSAMRDLAGVVMDARRYQVDALNEAGFSSAEYQWVRARVYQAAGVQAFDRRGLEEIADALRKGTGIESIRGTIDLGSVPPKNRELVKPYMTRMDEWLPLAFFGL